jgi:hypothetical protein
MNLERNHRSREPGPHRESGMATLVCIGLLAIMMILITAESRALYHLHREVKLLEQQQLKRLQVTPANTTTNLWEAK